MAQGKVEICGVNTAKLPILNEKEKEALFVRIKAGDQEAKEEYIKGNLRLVLHGHITTTQVTTAPSTPPAIMRPYLTGHANAFFSKAKRIVSIVKFIKKNTSTYNS